MLPYRIDSFAMRPAQKVLWKMILVGVIGLTLLAVTDVRVTIPGKNRDVSFEQVIGNLTSIFSDSDEHSELSGTKEWRLNWWVSAPCHPFDCRGAGPFPASPPPD